MLLVIASLGILLHQRREAGIVVSSDADISISLPRLKKSIIEKGPIHILCLGNSLTWGDDGNQGPVQVAEPWPAVLARDWRQNSSLSIAVGNAGVPGFTSAQILGQWAGLFSLFNVQLVLVKAGTNDLFTGISVEEYRANLLLLADSIRSQSLDLVFISPPPLARLRQNQRLQPYVQAMREVAIEKQVGFLNLNRLMGNHIQQGLRIQDMIPDGVHYTQAGYTLMGDMIYEYLQKALASTPNF